MSSEYRVPEPTARLPSDHVPREVQGYPTGAHVGRVRECAVTGCVGCRESLKRLSRHVGGVARDGEHHSLEAYNNND